MVADLIFSFQEMLDELQAMALIGSEFLTAGTQQAAIPNVIATLESIRAARPRVPKPWSVAPERSVRTIESIGEYEQGGRRGAHTVFGELTFIWDILCPQEPGPSSRPQKNFALSGRASTIIRVIASAGDGNERELAMWRVEIGDSAAPGCHFHTQIEGERAEPPYPHSLSVPRLPTILITPMAALEFLLGELFQSRWQQHAAAETAEMQRWKPIQKERLLRLFEWQKLCVRGCMGSPWTAFKAHKPAAGLFVETR
jgi:hypothetical protein